MTNSHKIGLYLCLADSEISGHPRGCPSIHRNPCPGSKCRPYTDAGDWGSSKSFLGEDTHGSVLSATIHPDIKRTLVTMSERTGLTVSQVADEVLYTGLIEMQELDLAKR